MRPLALLLLGVLFSQDWTPMGRRPVDARMHGYWDGRLPIAGQLHDVTLHFSPRSRPIVTLARRGLDGMFPLPASSATFTPTSVEATFTKPLAFSVTAHLREDGTSLDVTLLERGVRQTGVFIRVDAPGGLRRPQTPHPPFPYDEFDDIIDTGDGLLGATLTLPRGTGRFPGVVLLSGTGSQDRDYETAGHRSFAVLADHLTSTEALEKFKWS